MLLVNKILCS